MKFIDLFSGIGGFRSALEKNGHECVGFAEIDKFAIQSYKAMYDTENEIELGDISKISDEYITKLKDQVDVVVGGSPCFRAGTLITTKEGLKPIEQIKKGDEVLTHENRFRPVVMPMITHADSIYKLRVMNSIPTYVTEEHPFLVVERTKVWKSDGYEYEFSEPTWIKAKDLVKNKHFIKLGKTSEALNPNNITDEEAWLIGRYIADGYLMDSKRKDRKNSFRRDVVYCVGKNKSNVFESNLDEYDFGKSEDRTVYKYRKRSERLFDLMERCGRGSYNKEIPREYLNLPKYLLEKVIDGYLSGDGSYKDGVYSATTVSPKLALSLVEAFNKLHENGSSVIFTKRPDKCTIEGREVNQRDTYRVQTRFFYNKGANPHTIKIGEELYAPIRVLEKEETDELVYNFEVEEDNSYVANNLVAHNCQSFSMAGNRGGFDDTRGTLFFEYARTVKDVQPKYFIFENVKGMLSHDKGNTIRTVLNTFNDLGYYLDFNLFNSKFYDVPQNRERIYIVGKRKDLVDSPKYHTTKPRKLKIDEIHNWAVENIEFVELLPELKKDVSTRLVDVLEPHVDEKFYLDESKTNRLLERIKNKQVSDITDKQVADYRYDEGLRIRENNISPCLTANLKSMGTDNKDLSNSIYVTEDPKITVVGNTSNTGYRSHNVHDIDGLIPTIAARDYKGPKQIAVPKQEFKVKPSEVDYYAYDDKVFVGTVVKQFDGEPHYAYLDPLEVELSESLKLIINNEGSQAELLETTEDDGVYHSLGVYSSITSKESFGRFGKQAIETLFNNLDSAKHGDTINAFNRTLDSTGVSPTLTTRPDGFKTAILPVVEEPKVYGSLNTNDSLRFFRGVKEGVSRTLKSNKHDVGVMLEETNADTMSVNVRIRKLTPKECWRLQGFTDKQFNRAQQAGTSNSQLYKQAGNAVTVNVVDYIAKHLLV